MTEQAAVATFEERQPFPSIRAGLTLMNGSPSLGGACLCLLLAAMLGLFPASYLASNWALLTRGEWTQGQVTARNPVAVRPLLRWPLAVVLAHGGGRRQGPRYSVTVTLIARRGATQTATDFVDGATWSRLQPGDQVDVLYDPAQPQHCRVWAGLESGDVVALVMGTISLLLVAAAIALALQAIRVIGAEVSLLRDGDLVVGEVSDLKTKWHRKRVHSQSLNYRYQVRRRLAGPPESLEGGYVITHRWVKSSLVGQTVPVVVDPMNPERSTVDWFGLRTNWPHPSGGV
jgi:hypothetical protein